MTAQTDDGKVAWVGFSAGSGGAKAAEAFERRSRPVLDLATPAFRSAVSAVEHLADHANALGIVLDHMEEPLMIADLCGRVQHLNRYLISLLKREPRGSGILAAMQQSAIDLLGLTTTAQLPGAVATDAGRYRPHALFAGPSLGGGAPLVVVKLEDVDTTALRLEELQRRFGLTRRQAEVAGLLMEGATAKRVAAVLGIRTNTARNHIQAVLRRLGVSSKAELPARILSWAVS
jgi:DNA-binding CsgD family transcriptional regulator